MTPFKPNFAGNNEDVPKVKTDPKTESGQTEDVSPNAGTAAIPCFEEPAAPRGRANDGADGGPTGPPSFKD